MTIEIREVTGLGPLYNRYGYQMKPQPAFLSLDCESGELSAGIDSNIGGGSSMRVWNGIDLRWRVPSTLTASQVNDLLAEIKPLAEQVFAGHTIKWDGNNHRGRLDIDGQIASDEIERFCEELEGDLEVWSAGDWLGNLSDKELLTADAAKLEAEAIAEGIYLDGGVETEIKRRTKKLRLEIEEKAAYRAKSLAEIAAGCECATCELPAVRLDGDDDPACEGHAVKC